MPRKPQITNKNLSINAKNDGFYKAGLFKINNSGKVASINGENNLIEQEDFGQFLINPSTIEDNKSSNWTEHHIPGQSSPIYQWTSGGARILSFEALVTKDSSHWLERKSGPGNMVDMAMSFVGDIASSFAGVNIPPLSDIKGLFGIKDDSEIEGNELSITGYLDYYRSLLYPSYANNKLVSSPPLLSLIIGNSIKGTAPGESISKIDDIWILLDLNIQITKMLPNLNPMEAVVQFKLAQYTIVSKFSTDKPNFTGDINISSSVPFIS